MKKIYSVMSIYAFYHTEKVKSIDLNISTEESSNKKHIKVLLEK